ncbi:adenylate cyclase [Picosynechococcus sp. PCC 7003]|uniref:CYTH domain-containing protein n=1 Tax=Picosynechococcus sp. PCC 7003 TaxID=374981 RepID=UPI000810BCC4|nr:CYTH domain-containing protein [Picosynechococcus sp. PCC 7003]ANV83807.1 adenylate cyclase [Picosynechococcus sp. PCC 7003]
MPQEIERKFLVIGDRWRDLAPGIPYRQGYLQRTPEKTVRVRIAGEQAFLTIKGKTEGIRRLEFEYPIPLIEALEMLEHLGDRPQIEKIRYRIPLDNFLWEVDEFLGENQGLILAEIELTTADQVFPKPNWIGPEVSHEPRYYNANLVSYPYCQWSPTEQSP